jgi:alpha-D-ribose 1-methylphosphonate 5-triphosphate diphosphatase
MTTVNDELLTNARLVLPARVIEHGWVAMSGGKIIEIGEGQPPERGLDMGGDLVLPGLVELHTDHIEQHFLPRPGVVWHPLAAALSYDAQIAASGITTVFDCFRVGTDERKDTFSEHVAALWQTVQDAQAKGLLRARHLTHLRCEVCTPDVVDGLEAMLAQGPAEIISLMDHTPGQRQFRSIETLKSYYRRATNMAEAELDQMIANRLDLHAQYAVPHRHALVALARRHGIRLASHDDTTTEQVAEATRDGVSIAEFPVTVEAAAASHAAGISVLMGAPNVVRGGSHSGNVAAIELAHAGVLDILSSDYVPASLLFAAFRLARDVPGIDLPAAIRTVTATPAAAAGLQDRGRLEAGCAADIVRVSDGADVPVIRAVWCGGRRVM